MPVTGLNEVLTNLKKEIGKIEGATFEGMRKVSLFVEGESNEIVPMDKGVLINSSFSGADFKPGTGIIKARVGYTAEYAPYMHEIKDPYTPKSNVIAGPRQSTGVKWTKIGTGNKFLEKAVKNNVPMILNIIKKSAEIK